MQKSASQQNELQTTVKRRQRRGGRLRDCMQQSLRSKEVWWWQSRGAQQDQAWAANHKRPITVVPNLTPECAHTKVPYITGKRLRAEPGRNRIRGAANNVQQDLRRQAGQRGPDCRHARCRCC